MATHVRIDRLLVERGLFESRAKAQAAIAAGRVTADDVLDRQAVTARFQPPRSCMPSRRTPTCRAAA